MKDIEELDGMTLWEIVVNEGALTMLVLSIHLFVLFLLCSYIGLYYWVKSKIQRKGDKR